MLVELSIADLALIERAELLFGPGLNCITGETGSGKSLLVGALELLMGRAPRGGVVTAVREGADRARVEGRFALEETRARVMRWLAERLPEVAEEVRTEGELILSRTAGRDGRTRAHVNGRAVTRAALRELSALLIEIHGQHEHQDLFEAAEQTRLLDTYAKASAERTAYEAARTHWRAAAERLTRIELERGERRERLEFLRFQRDEIEALQLEQGERARLDEDLELLRGAGSLSRELGGVVAALAESDDAALDRLRQAERTLDAWAAKLPSLAPAHEELRSAVVHAEEAAAAVASFADGVEVDPARLAVVEERLDAVIRLEHKHGLGGGDELLERVDSLAREIEELDARESDAAGLGALVASARLELASAAEALSRRRVAAAPKLARATTKALVGLGLDRARFDVRIEPRSAEEGDDRRFGESGTDRIAFLLAANPGEPAHELRDVASGGEAARIMLALRAMHASADAGRTLVFDEIDSGVGGRLGPEVGARLRAVAGRHQVLCVTHLPAIAAMAHTHLRVAKAITRGRTRTVVESLDGAARVDEVADMIAGGAEEATARAEAQRLLDHADVTTT